MSTDNNNANDVNNENYDSSSKEVKFNCEPCGINFPSKFNYIRHMKLPDFLVLEIVMTD